MILDLSLEKLAQLVGGDLTGPLPHTFIIKNIAALESALSDDIAVILDPGNQSVFDGVSAEKIEKSHAGIILATQATVPGKNYLLVKDTLTAFQKIIDYANKKDKTIALPLGQMPFVSTSAIIAQDAFIEPSAHICAGANIGAGTVVDALVFVGRNCIIGEHVTLHPGAKILDNCVIGDHSIIHANAVIGSDGFGYNVTAQGLRKIPHVGIVQIGKHVEIGANCSLDRATFGKTILEDHVKVDNNVHIAHNVKIGMGTAILAQTGIAGSATIGKGCQIGGQVAIKNGIHIGNGVKIVSKSAILNDVKDNETLCGIPGIPFGQWKRITVALGKLPEMFKVAREVSAILEKQKQKRSFWKWLFRR
ncbi:MAG: UDP-3-O-(3-hydroxymyristoyl)glucosamine N-acyltransferase [bacterium]